MRQAVQEMYRAFTETFTGLWTRAAEGGSAGDLCPDDIFGRAAADGAAALRVMSAPHRALQAPFLLHA